MPHLRPSTGARRKACGRELVLATAFARGRTLVAIRTRHDGTIPGSFSPACVGGGPPRSRGVYPEVAGPDDEVRDLLDQLAEEAERGSPRSRLASLPEGLTPLTGEVRPGTLVRFGRSSLAHILARANVSHGAVIATSLCGETSLAELASAEGMSNAWPCRECTGIAESALRAMPSRGSGAP